MVYSASVVLSYQQFGYNYYYLNKQAVSLVIGIFALIIGLRIDYRIWQKNAFGLFVVSLVFLIAVFIPGIGENLGGSSRWIHIGPLFFQPSELAKITFIFYLSSWISKKGDDIKSFEKGFIPFIFITALTGLLIMKEPDMGTTLIIAAIAVSIFYTSGAKLNHIFAGLISAAGVFWILIKTSPYRLQRFLVFLDPNAKSLDAGYHINQALLAIGSGGWWGLGFGQSKQKYLYLPEVHIDSIYAIIVEELGFLRSGLVIIAFILLGYIGYRIAKTAPDNFSKLVATGITSWFVFQAFLNIATMLGAVPLTGVPLPFISYGGSSLIVLLFAVGVLMNISKQCNK